MDRLYFILNNNPVNNIEDALLLYETQYNKIIYMKNSLTISEFDNKDMYSKSENAYMYYFNKIRIYYLNYIKSKERFIKNNAQLRTDTLEFIKTHNLEVEKNKQQAYKNNKERHIGMTNTAFTKKINENAQAKKKMADLDADAKTKPKQKPKKRSTPSSHKPAPSFFSKLKNFVKNIVGRKENNFFKKVFKRISVKTHPDKTPLPYLNFLFIESKKALEVRNYFILVLISGIIGLKQFKLCAMEKQLLNRNIQDLIDYRKQFVKNIVYIYDELPKNKKQQIIINCIKNNCLNVNFTSTF